MQPRLRQACGLTCSLMPAIPRRRIGTSYWSFLEMDW
jgi:hypothetical protein